MAPEIILYELGPTRSARVRWTLLEAGLPFESRGNDPAILHSDELRRVHPLGKLPAALIDGQPLFESAAAPGSPGSVISVGWEFAGTKSSQAGNGIVHRDIATRNVLVTTTEGVYELDPAAGTLFFQNDGPPSLRGVGPRVLSLVTGAFGKRWFEIAGLLGKDAVALEVPWGQAVAPAELARALEDQGPFDAVTVTGNETSTGVVAPLDGYAEVLAGDHQSADEALFDELREHFSEAEIVDLGIRIMTFVGYGRLVRVLGLEIGGTCPLPHSA